MEFSNYLAENMLILTPVLYILGNFLKQTPHVKDWFIPWLLLIISVIFALMLGGCNIHSFIQGVVATGVTVLANQLVKQTSKKQDE